MARDTQAYEAARRMWLEFPRGVREPQPDDFVAPDSDDGEKDEHQARVASMAAQANVKLADW